MLDTNPHAWSLHAPDLSLSKALADILVFVNAHLAFNQANRIAIIASHSQSTAWLYPTPSKPLPNGHRALAESLGTGSRGMNANKYRPFALVEEEVIRNLQKLLKSTTPEELGTTTTTMIAGALTLALSYINRVTLSVTPASAAGGSNNVAGGGDASGSGTQQNTLLNSRIVMISTSGDLASQYIPLMNLTFAAQHGRTPIDILKLAGDTVLLQQASYTTSGVFLIPSKRQSAGSSPMKLLPTLLFAYLPDAVARVHLILPTSPDVDFRAACFCHRRVIDLGFVCSICLSIFCSDALPLPEERCLTCGTKLRIRADGAIKKKKKRKAADGSAINEG